MQRGLATVDGRGGRERGAAHLGLRRDQEAAGSGQGRTDPLGAAQRGIRFVGRQHAAQQQGFEGSIFLRQPEYVEERALVLADTMPARALDPDRARRPVPQRTHEAFEVGRGVGRVQAGEHVRDAPPRPNRAVQPRDPDAHAPQQHGLLD